VERKSCLNAGASVLAGAAIALVATGASAQRIYYPDKPGMTRVRPDRPLEHIGPYDAP
jgi:hypothetical protein